MAVLGDLEEAVMDVLWASTAPLVVRAVHEELNHGRPLAYTTVMTVLDRLAKKGIVRRSLSGRAWLYQPALTRADLVADEIVSLLSDGDAGQRLAAWASVLARFDPAPGAIVSRGVTFAPVGP
jgi:predicted transcriptional regulator